MSTAQPADAGIAETARIVGKRRDRDDIRRLLLDAAIVEFGERGFAGASTNTIAKRADAHQPQINYHFATKANLWRAVVDELFGRLAAHMGDKLHRIDDPAEQIATFIRYFVEFSAEQPELNQIMMHEGTQPSERLEWLTTTHVQPRFDMLSAAWMYLREAGVAAPIDPRLVFHVLTGAATHMIVSRAITQQLIGSDPCDPELIEAHIEGLVATLLPGYKP